MASNSSISRSSLPSVTSSILSLSSASPSILSSSIVSSVPPTVGPSASEPGPTSPPSASSPPSPAAIPSSSSTDIIFSSSAESSTFSSPLSFDSSTPIFHSSATSSQRSFDVASSIQTTLTTSSRPPETALSESTPASANHRTLRPVEISAIALGIVTTVLGFIALLLFFFIRRKRHQHHLLYGLPYAKENNGTNSSSHGNVEAREIPSGRSYFRSLSEQKGTTPLLENSAPNSSDLSHDEPYRDNGQASFPVLALDIPSLSFSRQEILYHPTMQTPRSPPPPKLQENSLLSAAIPEYIAPTSDTRSLRLSTLGSDRDAVLAYADENADVEGDTPSIYSQPSANFRFSTYTSLSRGLSVSSRVSAHPISVPPTVLEAPVVSDASPEHLDVDTRNRTMSSETITPATRSSPPSHSVCGDLGFLNTDPSQHQHRSHHSELERQNIMAVASLLKTRQRQSTAPFGVSYIERSGSTETAETAYGVEPDVGDIGVRRVSGGKNETEEREPYGRRFRRMKAEQEYPGTAI